MKWTAELVTWAYGFRKVLPVLGMDVLVEGTAASVLWDPAVPVPLWVLISGKVLLFGAVQWMFDPYALGSYGERRYTLLKALIVEGLFFFLLWIAGALWWFSFALQGIFSISLLLGYRCVWRWWKRKNFIPPMKP